MQSGIWRLFWKEYRAQRAVWLAIAAGTLLVQLILVLSVRLGSTTAQLTFVNLMPVTVVFASCYAGACAAILFAGEREDRTEELLRQFPISYGQLATGKFLYSLVAVAALACLGILSSLLIAWVGKLSFQDGQFEALTSFETIQGNLLMLAMLGVLTLSVFANVLLFSLLTKSVLLSVTAGAALAVGTVGISWEILNSWRIPNEWQLTSALVWSGALFAVELVLLRRWLHGEPIAWEGGGWPGLRWAAIRTGWLSALRRVAALSPGSAREMGVLAWVELQPAARVAALLVTFALLLECRRWYFASPQDFGYLLVLLLVPLMLGLLSFFNDQRQRTMGFLCDRGASPGRVWWTKHLVWLGLALLTLWGFTACDAVLAARFWRPDIADGRSVLESVAISSFNRTPPWLWHPLSAVGAWTMLTLMTVSLYSIGQLFGLILRRTLLSFVIALLAAGLWLALTYLLLTIGVSPWWFLFPQAAAFLLGSRALLAGWLMERRGWRRTLHQGSWAVVPVLLLAIAIPRWRVSEIPVVDPGFDWEQRDRLLTEFPRDWSAQWEPLRGDLGMIYSGGFRRAEFRDSAISRLRALAAAIPEHEHDLIDPRLTSIAGDRLPLSSVGDVVVESLRERLRQDDLAGGWADLAAGLTTTRYLMTTAAGENAAWQLMQARMAIFGGLLHWAQQDSQGEESLAQAAEFLATREDELLPLAQAFMNEYVLWRQQAEQRGYGWEQAVDQNPDLLFFSRFPFSYFLHAEQQRMLRQLGSLTQQRLAGVLAFPGNMVAAHWIAGDDRFPELYTLFSGGVDFLANQQRHDATLRHGAMLVVALERFRLSHGRYPEALAELTPEYLSELPRDPYGGADFRYLPHGLPQPVAMSPDRTYAAGQPLLFSRGQQAGDLKFVRDVRTLPLSDSLVHAANLIRKSNLARFPDGVWIFHSDKPNSQGMRDTIVPVDPRPLLQCVAFVDSRREVEAFTPVDPAASDPDAETSSRDLKQETLLDIDPVPNPAAISPPIAVPDP